MCSLTRTGENEGAATKTKDLDAPSGETESRRDLRDLTAKRCVTNQSSCFRLHLRLWARLQLLLFIQFPLFNCFAAAQDDACFYSGYSYWFSAEFLAQIADYFGRNCELFFVVCFWHFVVTLSALTELFAASVGNCRTNERHNFMTNLPRNDWKMPERDGTKCNVFCVSVSLFMCVWVRLYLCVCVCVQEVGNALGHVGISGTQIVGRA